MSATDVKTNATVFAPTEEPLAAPLATGMETPEFDRPKNASALPPTQIEQTYGISDAEYAVLLKTVCKGAPREVAALFLLTCKRRGLDPFAKQVYLWPDKTDKDTGLPVPGCNWNIVASIDGLRSIASRSPYWRGQLRPVWEYRTNPDGTLATFPKDSDKYNNLEGRRIPESCEVVVQRAIPQDPTNASLYMEFTGITLFAEFVKRAFGKIQGNWSVQPEHQLRVRSEAMALRMGFPEEVGGIYTEEELSDRLREQARAEAVEAEFVDDDVTEIVSLANAQGMKRAQVMLEIRRDGAAKVLARLRDSAALTVEHAPAPVHAPPEVAADAGEPAESPSSGTPPAEPLHPPMTSGTRKKLFPLLDKLGLAEKPARIKFANDNGIQIESYKDLCEPDALKLLDAAKAMTEHIVDGVLVEGEEPCPACLAQPGNAHFMDCPEAI